MCLYGILGKICSLNNASRLLRANIATAYHMDLLYITYKSVNVTPWNAPDCQRMEHHYLYKSLIGIQNSL